MDNVYAEPVKISIHDNSETKVEAIRNLFFSNIFARGPRGISLKGRQENPLDNIRFSNCVFELTDYSAFKNEEFHGAQVKEKSHGGFPKLVDCLRVVFDNVEFKTKN